MEAETGHGFFATGRTEFLGGERGATANIGRELAEAAVDHVLIRTDESFIVPLRQALTARSGGRAAR
jgi:hypothetical protein